MADTSLMSPFNPQYSPQEEVRQDPVGLADQWRSFLADPASRASLMSFGAQLSQPVAPGNNWAGHIGQATGAAGEAATKAFSLEQGDIEKESKQVLREAQANAATSRAETAQANSETAATRGAAYESRVQAQNQLSEQQALTQANRRRFLDAQSELLFQKAQTEPDKAKADMMRAEAAQMRAESMRSKEEAQSQLYGARAADIPQAAQDRRTRTEAQAGYLGARTTDVPLAAEDRSNRNVIRQQDADTRSGTRLDRATAGQQAEERRVRQGEENVQAKREQTYTEYGKSILPGQPKLPYAEWLKQFGSGKPTAAPPAQGAPQPAPQQPQSPLQNAGGDPEAQWHQRSDGRMWMKSPDGRWFVQ